MGGQGLMDHHIRIGGFLRLITIVIMPLMWSCAAPPVVPSRDAGPSPDAPVPEAPITDTRVYVTQHELRVLFPREQRSVWSWPPEPVPQSAATSYRWGIGMLHGYRPKWLQISVWRSNAASQSSLAELLRVGRGGLCNGGMFLQCDGEHDVQVSARDNAVELVLRDSTEISWLFGSRPEWVRVFRDVPGQSRQPDDSVRVSYVDPQIPMPSPAFVAALDSARNDYLASINRISRSIRSRRDDESLSYMVDDYVLLEVSERRCRIDVCIEMRLDGTAFGWTIADTTIARLDLSPNGVFLHALRPGRTSLSVTGIHSSSDTLPWKPAMPDSLEASVLIIGKPGRIGIKPLP